MLLVKLDLGDQLGTIAPRPSSPAVLLVELDLGDQLGAIAGAVEFAGHARGRARRLAIGSRSPACSSRSRLVVVFGGWAPARRRSLAGRLARGELGGWPPGHVAIVGAAEFAGMFALELVADPAPAEIGREQGHARNLRDAPFDSPHC